LGRLVADTINLALQTVLPDPVSVHHLGLFRDPLSLQPVEYYNNLPFARPISSSSSTSTKSNTAAASLALLLDPVIATGGTAAAAIQTLKEWGAERVILISILGAHVGVTKAADEWAEGTEVWIGGMDNELNDHGMIKPGLGDIGDRLFLTLGK
jgi:uracil phosphoribosyltransferase